MVRFLLRMIGFILMAAAFAAVIVDGTRSVAARQIMMFSLGETAGWLFPAGMAELSKAADQAQPVVRPVLAQALLLPTWLATGGAAVLLLVAGRRPRDGMDFLADR